MLNRSGTVMAKLFHAASNRNINSKVEFNPTQTAITVNSKSSASHVSQLFHELQLLSQLLHLPSYGELRIHSLHSLVGSQEHCSSNNKTDNDKLSCFQEQSIHIRKKKMCNRTSDGEKTVQHFRKHYKGASWCQNEMWLKITLINSLKV